jgi:hypothetical protein
LYCAIRGPTCKLSKLREVILAAVAVVAMVGITYPPPPPSGGVFPDLDKKRRVAGKEKDLGSALLLILVVQ